MSLELFKLSSTNPNDSIGGGGCLCHPDGKATGCEPPYVVFERSFIDQDRSPHAVASAICLRAAVKQIAHKGDDIPALGEPVDMDAKLAEQPEATVKWEDLDDSTQRSVRSVAKPGDVVRLNYGVVQVPGTAEPEPEKEEEEEDPLAALAAEAPQEVPSSKPGQYERAEDDEEAPSII